jgi:hypothetical protein
LLLQLDTGLSFVLVLHKSSRELLILEFSKASVRTERVLSGRSIPPTILYIARAFADSAEGPMPLEATECASADDAIMRTKTLPMRPGHVAAIAYSVCGDLVSGGFDATMLRRFGNGWDQTATCDGMSATTKQER